MSHSGDTNKMVETPRTDAHIDGLRRDPEVSGCDRTLDFARQLERELAAAQQRIKRLEEAGDKIAYWFEAREQRHFDALESWRKAKEAKP